MCMCHDWNWQLGSLFEHATLPSPSKVLTPHICYFGMSGGSKVSLALNGSKQSKYVHSN